MTDEQEVGLVWRALTALDKQNPIWFKNVMTFRDMDTARRLWWWAHVKKQAALGVPAMQQLVNEVIKLRLTT